MSERIWGIALSLAGAVWIWDGWRLGQAERADSMFDVLGPDRYLILMGGLLLLTGVIIGFSKPDVVVTASGTREDDSSLGPLSAPIVFTLLLAGYALLIPALGYTGSTLIFFLLAYYLAGRRNLVGTAVASLISAAAFYVLFPYLADMSLPRGIMGF